MSPKRRTQTVVTVLAAISLTAGAIYAIGPLEDGGPRASIVAPSARSVAPAAMVTPAPSHAALVALARDNPMNLAQLGIERYKRQIRDYRCTFFKQERVNGKLGKVEKIDVLYREEPHSVFMKWLDNADQVRRALFVDSPQFRDNKGRQIALVEPAGAIARLFVSEVKLPIHGKRARQASRRTIDDFGFRNTLELLDDYNELARERGVLEFWYEGEGQIDGRPTFLLVRRLPYSGPNGPFPDARLEVHIDQEWLLPTAVYSYADDNRKTLLGSYVFTNVKLNPGLSATDFQF